MSRGRQVATGHTWFGVVTGLAAEARLIPNRPDTPDSQLRVACAGADSRRAESHAERLIGEGASALLSFGIAGALDPGLAPGDLIVSSGIVGPDGTRQPCDQAWLEDICDSLKDRQIAYRCGTILGSARALLTIEDKAEAFAASGCLAVDMESHAVATVAADAGLPFLALRCIADTARDVLPPFVGDTVTAEGEPDIGIAMLAMLRHPDQLPEALRLSRRSKKALSTLRKLGREPALLFRRFG